MAVRESRWLTEAGLRLEERLKARGLPHGVTTRALGNMKDASARARALAAAGAAGEPALLRQTHGTAIHVPAGTAVSGNISEGDGWITAERGRVCAVFVADCLPIFVWDRQGEAVGVFHSGWRGTAAGMPRAAVRAFRRFGIGPERLEAAVGPHIGGCCYAVGEEVAAKFRPEARRDGRLDLGLEARRQLEESGVAEELISVSPECTSCAPEAFFSFRRDKMDCRMLAFIGMR